MPSPSDGRQSRAWRKIKAEVLAASRVCWLCGHDGADTVDHVVPLSLRPDLAHDRNNLRPAHRSCNSRKGAKLPDQVVRVPTSRRW
jgi:5-methylcytosine-specific restriction endonuclease McrA